MRPCAFSPNSSGQSAIAPRQLRSGSFESDESRRVRGALEGERNSTLAEAAFNRRAARAAVELDRCGVEQEPLAAAGGYALTRNISEHS